MGLVLLGCLVLPKGATYAQTSPVDAPKPYRLSAAIHLGYRLPLNAPAEPNLADRFVDKHVQVLSDGLGLRLHAPTPWVYDLSFERAPYRSRTYLDKEVFLYETAVAYGGDVNVDLHYNDRKFQHRTLWLINGAVGYEFVRRRWTLTPSAGLGLILMDADSLVMRVKRLDANEEYRVVYVANDPRRQVLSARAGVELRYRVSPRIGLALDAQLTAAQPGVSYGVETRDELAGTVELAGVVEAAPWRTVDFGLALHYVILERPRRAKTR